MDSGSLLLDSLPVREFYLHLAQSLGISSQVPPAIRSVSIAQKTGGRSHRDALALVLGQASVDFSTSRVRIGISRGHLFEVVVQVPLDVAGSPDALQLAAEIYLEARLGEQLLDDWVACISVDRIARARGLVMVSDVVTQAEHHPLESSVDLLLHGIERLTAELPESLFAVSSVAEDWLALDIPPCDSALQPERCFASTRFPEALKCALEGMPFSSRRFTRGSEVFGWLSWAPSGSRHERLKTRDQVEAALVDAFRGGSVLFAGSGFGEKRDYADVWVLLESPGLFRVLSGLAASLEDLEFGLYDSPLQRHSLRLSEGR